MGTDKRERQRAARLEKTAAEQAAAKRERTKGTAIRIVVAAAIIIAVLFAVTTFMGDDGDDGGETAAETTTTEAPTTTAPTTTTTPDYSNPELAAEVLERDPPEPEPPAEDTPADAVEITTLIEGEGDEVAEGDTVTVHYVGVLADGTEFDQSWERGQPFPVENVGQAAVIEGWNEGLIGAKVGERRHVVIGSDKAYGPEGSPPAIPPAAPLAFDIDVVDIQPGG